MERRGEGGEAINTGIDCLFPRLSTPTESNRQAVCAFFFRSVHPRPESREPCPGCLRKSEIHTTTIVLALPPPPPPPQQGGLTFDALYVMCDTSMQVRVSADPFVLVSAISVGYHDPFDEAGGMGMGDQVCA